MSYAKTIFFKFSYSLDIMPILQYAELFQNLSTGFWEKWGQSWQIWNPTSPPNWGRSPKQKLFCLGVTRAI